MQGKSGGYGYGARVPLAGLPPGLYVLKIQGKSRVGDGNAVERQVQFRIAEAVASSESMTEVLAALALFLQTPTGNMLTPRTVDKGSRSEVASTRQVTVRDADAWAALWRSHAPDRPQPAVDFAREMVVGIFLGTRPTAGFAVEMVGYRLEGDRAVVTYRESRPGGGTLTAQVLTAPYHLAVIPARSRRRHLRKGSIGDRRPSLYFFAAGVVAGRLRGFFARRIHRLHRVRLSRCRSRG